MTDGPFFNPLKKGDRVALIAPSGATTVERLEAGAAEISRAGFTPFLHPQCYARHGRFAGDDATRLCALHEAFADPSVNVILCARGGYGCQRFVDQLDFDLIRRNPKPLVGYSDITALLNPIAARCGFPTFHGPMTGDLTREDTADNWCHLWRMLQGEPVHPTDHPATCQSRVRVEGTATGRLGGGNLTILTTDAGTPMQIDPPEILFLEDVNEDLYHFDRQLWQLKRAGMFARLKGVLVGELVGVGDKGPPAFGRTVDEVLEDHFRPLAVPLVFDFPAGHGPRRTTLPLGGAVSLEACGDTVRLTHAPLFH